MIAKSKQFHGSLKYLCGRGYSAISLSDLGFNYEDGNYQALNYAECSCFK